MLFKKKKGEKKNIRTNREKTVVADALRKRLALADLLARTIVSPKELAVGAVTALVGAPFFAYVYFGRRRRQRDA